MKQITYAGTSFVTGTDIADALLKLVAALGHSAATAAVRVPALDDDNTATTIDLVIGPSSEIVATLVNVDVDELVDEVAVSSLELQAEALSRPRAAAPTSTEALSTGWNEPALDDLGDTI